MSKYTKLGGKREIKKAINHYKWLIAKSTNLRDRRRL